MQVLNPTLYRRLKRIFKHVRVSNEGEAACYRGVHDVDHRPNLFFTHTGEYYQVCCPFCTDTRFRLYVNHLYGKVDTFGRTMKFLAVCYNEGCLNKLSNSDSLWDDLSGGNDEFLTEAFTNKGREVPIEARETTWPGPVKQLSKLRDDHPAVQYLVDRKFDPDYLGDYFDVRYCEESHYYLCRNRLIIPVYEGDKLKGWQARFIGEWKKGMPPKYFTLPGMPRRSLIYNFDEARHYKTGIVMEGPSDVWAVGLMGMCTFGATMTPLQQRMFIAVFKERNGVLLYDPEEFEKPATQKLIRLLREKMPDRIAALKLPNGIDPGSFGSLGRTFLRDFIYEKALEQGVRVSYKRAA